MRNTSLDPLLSRAMQGLLAATCMAPDRAWYLSDLAKQLGCTPSTLQKPLGQLVEAGILKQWKDGNRVYFQADANCPFLPELQGLVTKTVGLIDVLRDHLARHQSRIAVAFVYGSVARGTQHSTSDVDLLIIGETTLRQLSAVLERAEAELGRPVNATVYTPAEFGQRVKEKNHFLRAVLDKEKLFVLGTSHELAAITDRRPRRNAPDESPGTQRPAIRRRQKSG